MENKKTEVVLDGEFSVMVQMQNVVFDYSFFDHDNVWLLQQLESIVKPSDN